MYSTLGVWSQLTTLTMDKNLSKSILAGVIYLGFSFYLYQPYLNAFNRLQYLLIINSCLASLGVFLLSRRWVSSFVGSFFAGAIYGFGPFLLTMAKFHPTAGLLAASIPWLFCPAAFCFKLKWWLLRIPLSLLPFLVIFIFFRADAHYRLFAVPLQTKLGIADLAGLLAPLVMVKRSPVLLSFYHIPIAVLVMGFSMLLAARRFNIIIIFCAGTALAFCDSFFNISPLIWISIPIVCCSVLIGAGTQGLTSAGRGDRKWILAVSIIMMVLSIISLLFATKYFQIFLGLGAPVAKLFVDTAKIYLLSSVAISLIYFVTRANLRIHWLRQVVLSFAIVVDIFLGARFIIDKIF